MRRLFGSVFALALVAAGQPPLGEPDIARLVDAKPDSPGCAVAIVADGRTVFAKGYGLADLGTRRPITPDTAFNIASMTKQFTGMAIALLIADGKLAESDDVRKYLPELNDYGQPIRIANLLNHSSGLRNHMALAAFQPGDHLPSHQEALALVYRQSALNFAPGTRHQYESPNYVLLAEIVSRVSGVPYERFLEQRIFKPLGMTNTGFAAPGLARAYRKDGNGWTLQERVNRAKGSSGLLSTVNDFAKWMANYDALTVGGAPAREKMLSTSTLADGSPITYRFGLVKEFDYAGVKGLTRITHGGQTAAYRSAFSYFPGRGFGDVVMCNYLTDAHAVDQAIVSAFVGKLKPPQPASVGGSGTAEGMRAELPSEVAGTYYSAADDDVREFVVKDGGLALRVFGQEFPLRFASARRFELEGQGTFEFSRGRMTERIAEQAVLSFDKLSAPPAMRLSDFAGTYRSRDVDGSVIIAVRGDKLALTYPAGEAELAAISADLFANQAFDFNAVRFQRDASGRVTGLTLSVSSGITRLRFERVR